MKIVDDVYHMPKPQFCNIKTEIKNFKKLEQYANIEDVHSYMLYHLDKDSDCKTEELKGGYLTLDSMNHKFDFKN